MIAAGLFIGAMFVVLVLLVVGFITWKRKQSSLGQVGNSSVGLTSDSSADFSLLAGWGGSSTSSGPDLSGHAGAHHGSVDCGHAYGGFASGHGGGIDGGGHH